MDIHQALVNRCRNGDGRAQYELYHLYAKSMYNVCMRIVNHTKEAEDILQESFVEAFMNIGQFRAEASFGAWLKRIVVNRSINYLKKKKLALFEEIPGADTMTDEVPDQGDDRQWQVREVHTAISALPDGYRLVINLYLLEGYDHGEIAQILNITESTSKSQYNRGKAKLRELLKSKRYER